MSPIPNPSIPKKTKDELLFDFQVYLTHYQVILGGILALGLYFIQFNQLNYQLVFGMTFLLLIFTFMHCRDKENQVRKELGFVGTSKKRVNDMDDATKNGLKILGRWLEPFGLAVAAGGVVGAIGNLSVAIYFIVIGAIVAGLGTIISERYKT